MSDLINRADAIEVLGEEPEIWIDTEEEWAYHNAWAEHISAIKALPSAEAVQGEWKRVPTRTYKGECTNCGFRHIFMDGHDSQYRFCPNCGAQMVQGGDSE